MLVFVLAMLVAIVTSAYETVHAEFVKEGKELWTLDRVAKYLRKQMKQLHETIQEKHNGSYMAYGKLRMVNWMKGTQEEDEDEDDVEANEANTGPPEPALIMDDDRSPYERERVELEMTALDRLDDIMELINGVKDSSNEIGDHLRRVDLVQARIDAGGATQNAVDKTVLTLATEVLHRLR